MSLAGAVPGSEQRRPTNRLFALYLLLVATALLFPGRPPGWSIILLLHLLLAAVLAGIGPFAALGRRTEGRFPRAFTVLADWYPLLAIPLLYSELAVLNQAVWSGRYFDGLVQQWEAAAFAGQPSRELAARFPFLPLSEFLHAAYLSYYLIVYLPPLVLYAKNRRDDFRTVVFTLLLTFFVHYLFFIYFPVQGPRYLFPPPDGAIASGSFYALAHQILEAGSSRGAAFPSSHVGVALAQTLLAFRMLPRLAPLLAFMTLALGLGAVYGGFHYAADVSAGLLLGALAVMIAPRVRAKLGGTRQVRG